MIRELQADDRRERCPECGKKIDACYCWKDALLDEEEETEFEIVED